MCVVRVAPRPRHSGNVFTALVCNARLGGYVAIQAPTNTLGTVYTARAVLLEIGNASPAVQLAVNPVQTACHAFELLATASDPDGTVATSTEVVTPVVRLTNATYLFSVALYADAMA